MFYTNQIFMFVTLLTSLNIITETKGSAEETELIKRLLDPKVYNKDVIPQSHGNESGIELKFGMALLMIEQLNSKDGYLDSTVWCRMIWNDDRLKFNGTRSSVEIKVMRIPHSKVWTPSIQLGNGYEKLPEKPTDNVLVYPTGEVLWVPHMKIKTSCIVDATYFPFDQQTCSFKFLDPIHSAEEMRLSLYNNKNFIDMSDYWKSVNWAFVRSSGIINTQSPPGEPKTQGVTFYLTLQRRPRHRYTLTLIIPSILISFITVLTFGLPTNSNEKLMTSFVAMVSLILILVHIGNVVPPSASQIPIITKYVLFVLVLHVLSIIGTTLILHLGSNESDMPELIREIILLKLGKIVRVNPAGNEKIDKTENSKGVAGGSENHLGEQMNGDSKICDAENTIMNALSKKKIQNQKNEAWTTVAFILDRSCFLIFLTAAIIGAVVYVAISKTGNTVDEDAAIGHFLELGRWTPPSPSSNEN